MQRIIAAYPDIASTQRGVEQLVAHGIPKDAISVVMGESTAGLAPSPGASVPEPTTTIPEGALGGSALGALVGGLTAVAALALPGVGVLAAGPIAFVLAGSGVGALGGGFVGAMVGLGMPKKDAEVFAERVLAKGIVVAVDLPSPESAELVENILDESGALELRDLSPRKDAGGALPPEANAAP